MAKMRELSLICSCKPRSSPNTFDKVSRYQRGKCDKVFTGLPAFIKDVRYYKHPMLFARLAKQTKRHRKRFVDKVPLTVFSAVCERKYFTIVSITTELCHRKIARPNARPKSS